MKGVNHFIIRPVFYIAFISIYIFTIYKNTHISPFELKSDYLQYFNFYNSGDYRINRFGSEIFLPFAFNFSNRLGLDFYSFVFVFGFFWLLPILAISKKIKTKYLAFYFSFFLFYFVNDYAFLMRQYFAFLFFLAYLYLNNNSRYLFLLLAITSHISALLFLVFSLINFKNRKAYYIVFIIAVAIFILNLSGVGFSNILTVVSKSDIGSYDLQRKLGLVERLNSDVEPGGFKNYIILIISMSIHMTYLYLGGKNNKLLLVFFFGAVISLLFSDFKILSNRFGFSAYYFSLPYLFYSASLLRLNGFGKIKLSRCE